MFCASLPLFSLILSFMKRAQLTLLHADRRHELQTRISLFFSAASLSGAFSGLLAAAIVKMDGLGGKEGWRFIFFLEVRVLARLARLADDSLLSATLLTRSLPPSLSVRRVASPSFSASRPSSSCLARRRTRASSRPSSGPTSSAASSSTARPARRTTSTTSSPGARCAWLQRARTSCSSSSRSSATASRSVRLTSLPRLVRPLLTLPRLCRRF